MRHAARRPVASLALLATLVAACAAPPRDALPIERVVRDPSGPHPFRFEFSPDARTVTYLLERPAGGLTDLWSYDVASGRHEILLRAEGEGTLTPEERAARERRRESHLGLTEYAWNPRGGSLLLPVSGDLYVLERGALRRITETPEPERDARWSPDGACVAWVRGAQLFADGVALTSDGGGRVRNGLAEFIAMEELDRHDGYWWSPDSTRIAYVRTDSSAVPEFGVPDALDERGGAAPQEYPRAGDPNAAWRLGVVPAKGGATVWMEVADEYLARVDWMGPGALAVQTLDRPQRRLRLWRCDAESGKAALLLEENDPAWIELSGDTRCLRDGRLLWSSDRSGRRALYLVEPGGTRALVEGDRLVDGVVGVDEAKGWVYFAAQEGFPPARHLYRVALAGGAPERLTRAPGWHAITPSRDCSRFVDSCSRAGVPPRFSLLRADGTEEALLRSPSPFPSLPKPEFTLVPAADGSTLFAMLLRPARSGRGPALLHVYGGPGAQMVADRWGGSTYLFHARLAQLGYAVLAVDNRGSGGRGRAFSRMHAGRIGVVEVDDQAQAARWLARQPFVDPARVGVWGWSYGGTTTLHCLLRAPETFACGVAVAPVADWRDYDTAYTERYLGLPAENAEAYARASPITAAASLRRPLLLVHGLADDNVHFRGAAALLDAAQRAGVLVEQDFWPRGAHGIGGPDACALLYRRMEEFFGRRLASPTPAPAANPTAPESPAGVPKPP